MPLLGKVPLSEDAARARRRRRRRWSLERSRRPGLAGDPPGRARDRRRDAAGAAGDAGATPAARRAAAGQRHRAAGRPGPGLSRCDSRIASSTAPGGTSASPIHVAERRSTTSRRFERRRRRPLRPFELEEVGRRRRQAARATCSATSASTRSPGRGAGASVVGLDFSAPAVEARDRARGGDRARRRFVDADVYDAARGARRRALRRRLHRPRRAQLAPRPAALGATVVAVRCSPDGGLLVPGRVPPVHRRASRTRT